MTDLERFATVASFREAMAHAPEDGYVLVNRVGNLNVYDKDFGWLGIINLVNVELHNRHHEDEPPLASYEDVGEEWR